MLESQLRRKMEEQPKHILTLEEALVAIKKDNDLDGEVESLLSEIDSIIEIATGIKWQEQETIHPLAKAVARLQLQIETGFVKNPMYTESLTSKMKQLQLLAIEE